ncbi:patatin-like phospholipase family protein [Rugamonas sp. DEMB1]|uniref:patatin-like phospholipase family protein n=1 Tax=Rugamonas sp. DEMB1 TaxID=3039386 RepID=UPI00244B4A70|nr:patatin-like phospholipase family protein [Rugamonas sp. DEMB1]WGG51901.1 patatin-like phospholipase family protein [Rugamonas sp. DEMB1]
MSIKVQLVLQGGGAKIYAIMAFLEALQDIAADKKQRHIEVTSIVGSSAGAIAGTLFAAKIDLCALRAAFKADGAGYSLVKEFSESKSRFWKFIRLCKLILLRAPFWSQRPLEVFLKNQLDAKKIKTFADIKKLSNIDVHVLATDLTRREAHIFKESDDVVESLLHSAAIPFFFRSWHSRGDSKSQLLVDGGIAENFPASALKLPSNVYRLGVSFVEQSTATPTSATTFTVSLLDAAMSVSAQNSIRSLPAEDVYRLDSSISTFEFSKLIGENGAFAKEYDLLKLQAGEWLRAFIARKSDSLSPWELNPWSEENQTAVKLMCGLYRVYNEYENKIAYNYHSLLYRVVANSLLLGKAEPDEFECEVRFSAEDNEVRVLGLQFMDSLAWGMVRRDSAIEILDSNQNHRNFEVLPVMDQERSGHRILLVFLAEPIAAKDGVFTMRYRDKARTFFPGLVDKAAVGMPGCDEMVVNPSRAKSGIDKVQFLLEIPAAMYSKVTLADKPDSQPGKAMSQQECNAHGMVKHNFKRIGWVGTGIAGRWGVDVRLG